MNHVYYGILMPVGTGKTTLSLKYCDMLDLESILSPDDHVVAAKLRTDAMKSNDWSTYSTQWRTMLCSSWAKLSYDVKIRYKFILGHAIDDLRAIGVNVSNAIVLSDVGMRTLTSFIHCPIRNALAIRNKNDIITSCVSVGISVVECDSHAAIEVTVRALLRDHL